MKYNTRIAKCHLYTALINNGRWTFRDDLTRSLDIGACIETEAPDLAVVDHMGLVISSSESQSSVAQFDAALHDLHSAIKGTNCAAILINEIVKAAVQAGVAGLGDSRGSIRLESYAGAALTIVRDMTDGGDDPMLALTLTKNRHGPGWFIQRAQLFGGLGYLHVDPTLHRIAQSKPRRGKKDDDDE